MLNNDLTKPVCHGCSRKIDAAFILRQPMICISCDPEGGYPLLEKSPRNVAARPKVEDAPRDGRSILIYALGSWSIASWSGRGYWNLEIDACTLAYDSSGEHVKRSDEDVKAWIPLPEHPRI